MGKKHNKFKKRQSAHQPHAARQETAQPVSTSTQEMADTLVEIKSSELSKAITPEKPDEIALLNEKYAFVRRDVRKLIIVLGSLVLLFVAIYFVNTRTTLLTNLGNWIYKIGHFSI
ncbi:MAG: hypothetical protein Q7S80_00370 [bacterium]|nr:hypothetical protein [bacterium]